MATFLQLAQKAARNCPIPGGGPVSVTDTTPQETRMIAEWVADAWTTLQNVRRDWRWMQRKATFATTPNTSVYTPTAIGAQVADVLTLDGWERVFRYSFGTQRDCLVPYSEEGQFVAAHGEDVPTETGQPTEVTVRERDQALWLWPVPDDVYTVHVRFKIAPAALAVDADTPGMPAQHHDVLVWDAVEKWALDRGAENKVRQAVAERRRLMLSLIESQTDDFDIGWGNPLA